MVMVQNRAARHTQASYPDSSSIGSALTHFSRFHPLLSVSDTEQEVPEIVSYIESEGLLKVSIQKLMEGMNQSSGELQHYLSGLVYGYFFVRTIMDNLSIQMKAGANRALQTTVIDEIKATCEKELSLLNAKQYRPELAREFGIAETSACLLLHLSPKMGGIMLDKLYSRH